MTTICATGHVRLVKSNRQTKYAAMRCVSRMQNIIYIDHEPETVSWSSKVNVAKIWSDRIDQSFQKALEAVNGEFQSLDEPELDLLLLVTLFARTLEEPFRSTMLTQSEEHIRRLKHQSTKSQGETLDESDYVDALTLAKQVFLIESFGFSALLRDQLVTSLAFHEPTVEREAVCASVSRGELERIEEYRALLLLQYLCTKLNVRISGVEAGSVQEIWNATRGLHPYKRRVLQSAQGYKEWMAQTHLACDVVLIASEYGELSLPANALPFEAIYLSDEINLHRSIFHNEMLLTAKICFCLKILNATCEELLQSGVQYLVNAQQADGFWPLAINRVMMGCMAACALKEHRGRGLGPYDGKIVQMLQNQPAHERSDPEFIIRRSAKTRLLNQTLQIHYSRGLKDAGLQLPLSAEAFAEQRLQLLNNYNDTDK